MDPIFKTELGKLYCTDACKLMDYLINEGIEFQLIFADPPYNIGKAEWDYFPTQDEYLKWSIQWINKAGELLNEKGSLFVMGFSENLADIKYCAMRKCKWILSCRWIIWHYRNKPQMGKNDFTRSHESLLWLRKSKNYTFYADRIRVPYNIHTQKYPIRAQGQTSLFGSKKRYLWNPDIRGAKPRDVIDVPAVNNPSEENVDFPTQKPEELLRKIVWATTDKGDLVFDPFGGSGTTYVVCEQLGRRWIGCEIKRDYNEIAIERIKNIKRRKDPTYWAEKDLKSFKHRMRLRED